jgi:hypothetical protein
MLRGKFAEILHQIEGEAVVVINDQHHRQKGG